MHRLLRLALVALVLPLAACDSGDEGALAPNTFTLSVDGSAAVTRPDAYEGTFINEEGEQTFTLLLGAEPDQEDMTADLPIVQFARRGGQPSTGRYVLPDLNDLTVEPSRDAFLTLYLEPALLDPENPFSFTGISAATSGTLTVEESNAERISGTYSATVRQIDILAGGFTGSPVQSEGAFNAVFSDDFTTEITDAPTARQASRATVNSKLLAAHRSLARKVKP